MPNKIPKKNQGKEQMLELMLKSVKLYLSQFEEVGESAERILEAMRKIDRQDFVPNYSRESAYIDEALQIGSGQTISQPSTVARMLQLLYLRKGSSVLEIGTGSGWNAGLIGEIIGKKGKVVTTELRKELAKSAEKNIKKAGIKNVRIIVADFRKIKERFDRIIFTAGISAEQEKEIEKFAKSNLNRRGILVCPFRHGPLIIIKKEDSGRTKKNYTKEEYVFVPLLF